MINPALEAAARAAQSAVDSGTADAYDIAILALLASERGDYELADTLFDRALNMEPGNPSTLTSLAIHRRRQGRFRDALLACDDAITAYPAYADAWLERGITLGVGGSAAAAKASLEQAIRHAPHLAPAHAGLASLAARDGNGPDARRHAEAALAIDPSNAVAINALASAHLIAGDTAAARALLEPLLARLSFPSVDRAQTHSLLADCYNRQRDYRSAFAQYAASNADFAAINSRTTEGLVDHRSFVEALISGLDRLPSVDWSAPGEQPWEAASRHIFLIGYPRSGTTLVENILASLPGVAALEELPTLGATDKAFIAGEPSEIVTGLRDFAMLDAAALESHRQAYWDFALRSGVPANSVALVDMDPLKATRLPFIARLFPAARILIMRRDPRDVVWSCFRTNFAMASGTMEYVTLERAARHYDAMMRLTQLAIERLPIATHIVHYHRLVQDFDTETQAMCAFAGLEWTDNVRNFDQTASARGVSTASAGQVQRGLYDGTRQWEPYAEWLAPVLPILQPWIERFGYTD